MADSESTTSTPTGSRRRNAGALPPAPPDAKDDKALKMAEDLLHGIKSTSSATPAPATAPGDKAALDKPGNKAAN